MYLCNSVYFSPALWQNCMCLTCTIIYYYDILKLLTVQIRSILCSCKPRASANGTGSALMHSATWRGNPLHRRAGQIDTVQDGTAPNSQGQGWQVMLCDIMQKDAPKKLCEWSCNPAVRPVVLPGPRSVCHCCTDRLLKTCRANDFKWMQGIERQRKGSSNPAAWSFKNSSEMYE